MGDVGLFGVKETPALIAWRPYLDGEFQPDCVRGNCDEGWIERWVVEDGKHVRDGDAMRQERVYGRVELRPPDRAIFIPKRSDAKFEWVDG